MMAVILTIGDLKVLVDEASKRFSEDTLVELDTFAEWDDRSPSLPRLGPSEEWPFNLVLKEGA